ncbi:ComEC/Rec2 family competence protein [Flavobacterium sp. B183]|uniref:ComEC/Rec2 family competence protein n=1 Tax=Flavobacterium sp. B183 TaxID=907046 RepID=UPI00201E9122|nr:hypothetical protein [Flavobacterium sp. B183]URC14808.1 hypothetical protein M4I44_10595 [Flavobacterium sp. B183]
MKIKGKILNVKDGDAIIIQAEKGSEKLLIVIDGGDKDFKSKTLDQVKQYCQEMNKKAPDLIVCTHYDSDHIAGIITLIEHYKSEIGQVWVHQPHGQLKDSLRAAPLVLEHIQDNTSILDLNSYGLYHSYLAAPQFDKYKLVIESVDQLNNLLSLIKKYNISTREPVSGECSLDGWDEIKVIGPTREYYNKIIGKPKNMIEIFQDEYEYMILENAREKKQTSADPCTLLKTTSSITKTNKVSAVIKFDCEDGGYLFTGDAGIESFKAAEGYPESLRNLKFLKVPHHGSNNNISRELIDIMNPAIAYSSGYIHQDQEVIDCLSRRPGIQVKTTKESGDLTF